MFGLILLLLIVPKMLLSAFVLTKLWCWFLVPMGLPVITMVQAIGISMIVGYLTYQGNGKKYETLEEQISMAVNIFLTPLFYLLVATVVKAFI